MKKRYFIIGFAALVLIGGGIFAKAVYDDIKASDRMDVVLDQFAQGKIKTEDIDYKSLGQYAPFAREFCESATKLFNDVKVFSALPDSNQFKNFMDSKYLKDPVAGKNNMKNIIDNVFKNKQTIDNDTLRFSKSFDKLPAGDRDDKEIVKAEQDIKKELGDESTSVYNLFKSLSDKTNSFYDFLISKKGKYLVDNNGISFYSQQDLDSYNKYLDDIDKAVNGAPNTK